MLSDLAINEDGEPFAVPPQVRGWRARRVPRRGRPALVNDRGKPLIIGVDATHADLLAAAGPGRYRLEAVDEHGRKVADVPVACTGLLNDDESDDEATDDDGDTMFNGSAVRRPRMEDVLCQLLANQSRMVEATLGQMGTVIAGVAGLLHAVHHTGVVHQVPPPVVVPPPAMPKPPEPDPELEPDEAEEPAADAAPPSAIPEALRLIIERTIDTLVPLIFEKVTSQGLGGLPLAAILDWRKAMPGYKAGVASEPGAASAPAAPPAPTAPHAPPTAPTVPPAAPAAPTVPHVQPAGSMIPPAPVASVIPPAPASAGAAPSPSSPLGAAPAATVPAHADALTTQELTQEEAAALLNAHILQIWQGLTPTERNRASELIAQFTDVQRGAWFAELARLTVPDAIARARAVLRAPPPTSPTNPPPSATSKGDPS